MPEHRDAGDHRILDDGVSGEPSLFAYRTNPSGRKMPIVPASHSRAWMDTTTDKFANRCLPLKIANQAGWFILNDRTLRAT